MGVNDKLVQALNKSMSLAGQQIRVRYYTTVFDDVYDEAIELIQSGTNLWTSGLVMPIRGKEGSTESLLLNQGKLIDSDKKMYVNGSLVFTGSTLLVDVQLGSPTGDLYTTIPDGGEMWEAEGIPVYKKLFIRRLTGSLI